MTVNRGVSIAVVGCGYWGSKHVRVLHATEGVEHVALVDGCQPRLNNLGRNYPNALRFASLTDALPHIDAAIIATPPTTHVPLGLEALAAGKHVLVEKPLAPTVRGARELIAAAAHSGTVLMTGHTFEYNPAVWKLRELVQGRVLGDALLPRLAPDSTSVCTRTMSTSSSIWPRTTCRSSTTCWARSQSPSRHGPHVMPTRASRTLRTCA